VSALALVRPEERGDDWDTFCAGVRRLAGIDLSLYKRGQMERRVRSFAGQRGIFALDHYVHVLRNDPAELDALLDRVTINVSQLWRNPEQWTLIGRTLLPELAAGGRLTAWSAGCSYGAEAYTLAALCRECLPGARVQIVGTDVDPRMVDRARKGTFSDEDARSAPADALERHFERIPRGWLARPELLRLTRFEVGDLLRLPPRDGAYDLILCRNTVIYFTEPVRDELHSRLARSLRAGGYLVVGATERVSDPRSHGLEPVHPFTYRRQ
jgi:chemotaxis protein methyltransferase CheR